MADVFLSLILPVYNVEQYIEKCLQSIIMQNLSQCEVILVDDGAEDNSGKICDDFVKKYANFRVLHHSNVGLYQTRLDGAKIAKGEYIWFVDSDDWIMEGAIEKLISVLQKTEYPDVIVFGYSINGEKANNALEANNPGSFFEGEVDEAIENLCVGDEINAIWRKCIRRELVINNEYLPKINHFSFGEDAYITAAIFRKMRNIVFYNAILYSYRLCSYGMTRRYNPNRLADEEILFKRLKQVATDCDLPNSVLKRIELRSLKELIHTINSIMECDMLWNKKVEEIERSINLPFWNNILRNVSNEGLNKREKEIWEKIRLVQVGQSKKYFLLMIKYSTKQKIKKIVKWKKV